MRLVGSRSWQVREDHARRLSMALHVRDSVGIDTSTNPHAPPSLEPAVPVDDDLRRRFIDDAPAWSAWWSRLLRELSTAPTEYAAFTDAVAGAHGRARELLDAALPAAELWAREREQERRRAGRVPAFDLAINHVVRSVEKQLRRRAAPFRLDLLIVPVQGMWSFWTAVGVEAEAGPGLAPSPALLLSPQLRMDRVALDRVLRPIIARIA